MDKNEKKIDKVRASRDGHEFHEIWVARKTMQLLLPNNDLIGISIEGLGPEDQKNAIDETTEIADIVYYYGKDTTFEKAKRVKISQLKYSIANKDKDFRASDASKTIKKFADTYIDFIKRFGISKVDNKLSFELLTNRPIYLPLIKAINGIITGETLLGEIKNQADQLIKYSSLSEEDFVDFIKRFLFVSSADNLQSSKYELSQLITDWSASDDLRAKVRLGSLKEMVRDKAGYAGTEKNVIRRIDLFVALGISDQNELFPCPESLIKVQSLIEREQLSEAISLIKNIDKPLIVHAEGGVGKTVFLNSLATKLSSKNEVVFFDCFGGGSYRSPEDSRHLPKRGLIHIINTLACRGLCDPLLPDGSSTELLFLSFRKRLEQCIQTISSVSKDRQLILFLDAIDNSALCAKEKKQEAFPTLLLKSLFLTGSIPGLKIICSCRTSRINLAVDNIPYESFELRAFSLMETTKYLLDRKHDLTKIEIQVAQSRSGGNGRVLDYLMTDNRGLLDQSEINKNIELDDLIEKKVKTALQEANMRGYKDDDINTFLAGLVVLPPPIPIEEYSIAQGFDVGVVESFVADLAPLLEKTKYGLMFRDEPTETYIRNHYCTNKKILNKISKNLLKVQDMSVYAAQTLPQLLFSLNNGKALFKLAFDSRVPKTINSIVGKNHIRFLRIKSAICYFANKTNVNDLIHLLLELALVSSSDNRGIDFILDNPDLIIVANDIDSTRRLFETRTKWPGERHSRLTIAHSLSGDFENANRHSVTANEWIDYYYSQKHNQYDNDHVQPELLDIASIPLSLIVQNQYKNAILYLRKWRYWYQYNVLMKIFEMIQIKSTSREINDFLDNLDDEIGCLTASLVSLEINDTYKQKLISKLSTACNSVKKIDLANDFRFFDKYKISGGLLVSVVIAITQGLYSEAENIIKHVPCDRPKLYCFDEYSPLNDIIPFLIKLTLSSVKNGKEINFFDILPEELIGIGNKIKNKENEAFKDKLRDLIESKPGFIPTKKPKKENNLDYDTRRSAERFIETKIDSILAIVRAFSRVITAVTPKDLDEKFKNLLDAWSTARIKRDIYTRAEYNRFFQTLGGEIAILCLKIRNDLSIKSIKLFIDCFNDQPLKTPSKLIEIVNILAKRVDCHDLAGVVSANADKLINQETDVIHRASLYAELSRSILSANIFESQNYFRKGLSQVDTIGSDDNEFVNELLIFIASIKGKTELDEKHVHTLINMCELNLPEEEEKFAWFNYGKALSRVSGLKGLIKLSKWDDRSKISFDYTLLPYLTALVQDEKIEIEDALSLNRLSVPVELYGCNTGDFVSAMTSKIKPNTKLVLSDLIAQFQKNNPGYYCNDTTRKIVDLSKKIFGVDSVEYKSINTSCKKNDIFRRENSEFYTSNRKKISNKFVLNDLKKIIKTVFPITPNSIEDALKQVDNTEKLRDFKNDFLRLLRDSVPFSGRNDYIESLSNIEGINIYIRMGELFECKKQWFSSSPSIIVTLKQISFLILDKYPEEFISYGQLSFSKLKELSEISEESIVALAIELIKVFSSEEIDIPASAWLCLASIVNEESDESESLSALKRLLDSDATKLSETVIDGSLDSQLYLESDYCEIIAKFIWRSLGSPYAKNRWNAAHCVRLLAKYNRWDIFDKLILLYSSKDAGSFQASELKFYYLHARLWFLISIARISKDYPTKISKYFDSLLLIIKDNNQPHVVMRHFASQAIINCIESGDLKLAPDIEQFVRQINHSHFPRLTQKIKKSGGFYIGRPKTAPDPKREFHLDYDFEKYQVGNLSDVFGLEDWKVKDFISNAAYLIDPRVKSMYEKDERYDYRSRDIGMTKEFHTYGEQLGWHSLMIVAGELLNKYPITDDSYSFSGDPWSEWLDSYSLTIKEGLWLSDGTDKTPSIVSTSLLEKKSNEEDLTGDKDKILSLLNLKNNFKEVVIDAIWTSPDGVTVNISSALASISRSNSLIKKLINDDPFSVYLPSLRKDVYSGKEYLENKKVGYHPWIVNPYTDACLDEQDTSGTILAITKPKFSKKIVDKFFLVTDNPFNRIWEKDSVKVAFCESWKDNMSSKKDRESGGYRLLCKSKLLEEVLKVEKKDLLILVKLQRYKEGFLNKPSSFSNTAVVIKINSNLDIEYFEGPINKLSEC